MKRTITALLIITAILCAATLAACAQATASQEPEKPATEFHYVHDWAEPKVPSGMVRIKAEMDARAAEAAQEAAVATEAAPEPDYWEGTAYSGPYDPELNNNPAYIGGNPNGLNSFDGVYEYNGKTETFYASHAVYDDQLWVDDDGFFRDDQGRYVVASEDYAQGTEIEISQGKAVVMDGGCEPGTVDVHTTWGR